MKKVLAWAVALALVLSSFTMAFAADTKTSADFKDASEIQYTEAVDVMVATGVINGYPDGTFGPAKTVKRSEMAKMISVMLEGGEDIGDQFKGACPFADSKNHWAAGYIAYCSSEHIIDGRSADVFDPEAEVTGTEVAKMALTSLGYDSKIQGYTGENWAAAVLKDAKKKKLFEGLDSSFVPGDPCSREAAAQILFNTLQNKTVTYKNNTTVEIGDASISVSSEVEESKDPLYKDAFDNKLIKKDDEKTAEGKPAHKWFYPDKKTEIGTYPDDAAETAVADEATTAGKMVDEVEKGAAVGTVTLNGDKQTGTAKDFPIRVGDKVEMFETTVGTGEAAQDGYDLVVTRYELAKIVEVNTDISEKAKKDNPDLTANITINGETYANTAVVGYDAETYVDDTYLAIALSADKKTVIDSYVADTDQGVIEKRTKDAITVNGTASTISGNYDAGVGNATYTGSVAFTSLKVKDSTYDVYFDSEGYVLGAVVFEESEDVVGLYDGFKTDKDAYTQAETITVKILDENAEATEYVLAKAAENKKPTTSPALIKYELNDNDKVKNIITAASTPADNDFGSLTEDKEVSKRGLVGSSYILAEDVVAYYYTPAKTDSDGEVTEEAKWVTYGYEDLLGAKIKATSDKPVTFVKNSDGEIAYILLAQDITDETKDTVLGFYVSADSYFAGEKEQYDITVLVNGSEEVYKTTEDAVLTTDVTSILSKDAEAPVLMKLTLNKDKDATKVEIVKPAKKPDVQEEFDGFDAVEYQYDGDITAVSGQNLTFGSNITYVGDATVYRVKVDSEGKYDGLAKFSGKFVEGGAAVVYQLSKDSESWDNVVYITAADRSAWTGAPAPFAPTTAPSGDDSGNQEEVPN